LGKEIALSSVTKVLPQIITYGRWQVMGQRLELGRNQERRRTKMSKEITVARGKPGVQVVPGKEDVLAVLRRAAAESEFLARLADDPQEALKEYYSLNSEERAALASGDIRKIESWVGKLDKELATWLWCRLSQEKY
jgi:hypothetical protein